MNAFIIHGAYGTPQENWFPWLKSELEDLGCKVYVPKFPTPEGQNLINWMKIINEYKKEFNNETIFIGHSIGPAFILNILEQLDKPIRAAFFIAGFIGKFTGKWADPQFNLINKTIAEKTFNWQKIRHNCTSFYLFYSDNDPYVPQEKALELGQSLLVKPILVKNGGHFNKDAGFSEFPLLLDYIKKEL
ncbi:MAG: alpha/beta hydrolase [Nanoarchaeota archaeon]